MVRKERGKEFSTIEKFSAASIPFINPIKMAPVLWLALKPIQAFHIVVSWVNRGDVFFISSITFLFRGSNLVVKKV
jgi:hypothetical protein